MGGNIIIDEVFGYSKFYLDLDLYCWFCISIFFEVMLFWNVYIIIRFLDLIEFRRGEFFGISLFFLICLIVLFDKVI